MQRWNGWGDAAIESQLNADALRFLAERIGPSGAPNDVSREAFLRAVKPSRIDTGNSRLAFDAAARVDASFGQSLPDWLRLRFGVPGQVVDGVIAPQSSAEVREAIEHCNRIGAVVIPRGGATSVVGHLRPPDGERPVVVMRLDALNRLLDLDETAQLARFESGVLGPVLERQLASRGYVLGHFPQSFEYATLGGWVTTRSSGQQSMRYGRIENLFAGGRLESARETLDLPTFPASAAGPDLRETVLGSEGRLGVLSETVVRISTLPEHESFRAVFFPDWENGAACARALAQARVPLSMIRLSNPVETETMLALAGHANLITWLRRYLALRGVRESACMMVLGLTGRSALCKTAWREACAIAKPFGAVVIGKALGERWKANRFRSVYLRNTVWQYGYAIDTVETACDWPRVTPMMQAVEQAARDAYAAHGERIHAYTHLSHVYAQGSSVYSTFVFRLHPDFETNLQRWRDMKARVCEAMMRHGGTISHQHGVGKDHAPYLPAEKGEGGMRAIRALINHFDPTGLFDSGNLVSARA